MGFLDSASAEWSEVASATAATATATKAIRAGYRHYVTGISFSGSSAPAAAVTVTVKSASTAIDKFEMPAAAFAPFIVNYKRSLRGGVGEAVSIELPSLGPGVVGTVVIKGFSRQN